MKRLVQATLIAGLVWAVRAAVTGGLTVGMRSFDSASLSKGIASRNPIRATVVGVASVPASVTTAEVASGIGRLRVIGLFRSTPEVREALSGRVSVTGTILDAE